MTKSTMAAMTLAVLDEVAAVSKTTEKHAILSKVVGSEIEPFFTKVLKYAYHPSFRYGVTEYQRTEQSLGALSDDYLFTVLDNLNQRIATGNAAITMVENAYAHLSNECAELMHRILNHDMRCGVGAKGFNKVWNDLIYIHPYMRCSSFSEKNLSKIKFPCFSQIKMDGLYIDIVATETSVEYRTRAGNLLTLNEPHRDAKLKAAATVHGAMVLQGEALVLTESGKYMPRADGNAYLNQLDEAIDVERVVFVLWDAIDVESFLRGKSTTPYHERFNGDLRGYINSVYAPWLSVVQSKECNNLHDIIEHFKEARLFEEEGTILKNREMLWKDGTSTESVKVKVVVEGELRVVGIKEGQGKYVGMVGSLTCESEDGLVQVGVAGLSDKQRAEYFEFPERIVGKIIEVRYNDVEKDERTGVYSLFLPRFANERFDKDAADTLVKLKEQVHAFTDMMKVIK